MLELLKSSPVSVPVLTSVVYILLSLCGKYVSPKIIGGDNVFLIIIIIQLIAFVLPCFIYHELKGKRSKSISGVGSFKLSGLVLAISAFAVLLFGSYLIRLAFYQNGTDAAVDKGYMDALFAGERSGVGVFLAYCLVPAVCEELFFRLVVINEFREYGCFNAIIISALYFTMVHFTKEGFLVYFFAGLVLGTVAYISRSVFPSMIVHVGYNIMTLYGRTTFISKTVYNTSALFVAFVLAVLFLLSLAFMLSRMELAYKAYSTDEKETLPAKSVEHLYIYITPALIVPIAVFVLINTLL